MNSTAGFDEEPRSRRGVLRHEPRPYGRSELGAALECFGPSSGPVDVLIMASMHGDEVDSTVALSEAMRRVPENALKNPVILGVNPDGILRGTRCNGRGVDLNRNWPTADWSPAPVCYRGHDMAERNIELSPGESAGSEAETRALMDLVKTLQPRAIVTLHTPLGCIDDPNDSPLGRWIASEIGLPLVPDVGYPTPGSFGTWGAEQGIPVITWELPSESVAEVVASHVPALVRLITGTHGL